MLPALTAYVRVLGTYKLSAVPRPEPGAGRMKDSSCARVERCGFCHALRLACQLPWTEVRMMPVLHAVPHAEQSTWMVWGKKGKGNAEGCIQEKLKVRC